MARKSKKAAVDTNSNDRVLVRICADGTKIYFDPTVIKDPALRERMRANVKPVTED